MLYLFVTSCQHFHIHLIRKIHHKKTLSESSIKVENIFKIYFHTNVKNIYILLHALFNSSNLISEFQWLGMKPALSDHESYVKNSPLNPPCNRLAPKGKLK